MKRVGQGLKNLTQIFLVVASIATLNSCNSSNQTIDPKHLMRTKALVENPEFLTPEFRMEYTSPNCLRKILESFKRLKANDELGIYTMFFLDEDQMEDVDSLDASSFYLRTSMKQYGDLGMRFKLLNCFASGNYLYATCLDQSMTTEVEPAKIQLLAFEVLDGKVYYFDQSMLRMLESFNELLEKEMERTGA